MADPQSASQEFPAKINLRTIAELRDHPRFIEDGFSRSVLKGWLMNQRAEIVLIRKPQRTVMLVRPGDRQFERPSRIEARRPRIGINRRGRPRAGIIDVWPLALEECKRARHLL